MRAIIPCVVVILCNTYVNRIRQVAAMLGYGEPKILEVFENTIPNKLN